MRVTLEHEGISVEVLDGHYLFNGRPTDQAVAFYSRLVADIGVYKQFAAQSLLRLYNDVWLTDEIGMLDERSFAQKLHHPSVQIYDELGAAVVYFEDGDIFAGHSIEVTIRDEKPIHAQIVG